MILGSGWRQNRTWVLGIKWRSQVTKRGKIGWNRSLKYTHPFPPLSHQFFLYLLIFNSVAKKNGRHKNIGHVPLSPPQLSLWTKWNVVKFLQFKFKDQLRILIKCQPRFYHVRHRSQKNLVSLHVGVVHHLAKTPAGTFACGYSQSASRSS